MNNHHFLSIQFLNSSSAEFLNLFDKRLILDEFNQFYGAQTIYEFTISTDYRLAINSCPFISHKEHVVDYIDNLVYLQLSYN